MTHGNPTGTGGNTLWARCALATSTFRGDQNLSLALYLLATDDERGSRRCRRLHARLSERSLGRVSQLEADRRHFPAGARLRAAARDPQDRSVRSPFSRDRSAGASGSSSSIRTRPTSPIWKSRRELADLHGAVQLRTESGEHLEWNYIPEFEHLDVPFEIAPGVVMPPARTNGRASEPKRTPRPSVRGWSMPRSGGVASTMVHGDNSGSAYAEAQHARGRLAAGRTERRHVAGRRFYTQIVTVRADTISRRTSRGRT